MGPADETVERIGKYRIVRKLATGGTSDVLLAQAEGPHGFERTVVLKLLLSQFRDNDELTRMFAREASAYARLSHPSIVQLYDFFARDGQLVMVLEHVDGPSLARVRALLKAIHKQLDDRCALHVAACIFSALAAAHGTSDDRGGAAPVIHRDVNPSNVLLPWDGNVKLADFGMAKVTGLSHESRHGVIKGTFGYMAPEQVTAESVTPRADVYGAGIVLWELLTNRKAFQRGALPESELLRQMAEPRITKIDKLRPDLEPPLSRALAVALEPRAEARTITAEEMVAVLRKIVSEEEGREALAAAIGLVKARPQTLAGPPRPSANRLPKAAPPPAPSGRYGRGKTLPLGTTSPSGEVAVAPADASLPVGESEARPTSSGPLSLSQAIDEVLRDVPPSIPPDVFVELSPTTARTDSGDVPSTLREIGALPPAPKPLDPKSPQFPALDRTLALADAPLPRLIPTPDPSELSSRTTIPLSPSPLAKAGASPAPPFAGTAKMVVPAAVNERSAPRGEPGELATPLLTTASSSAVVVVSGDPPRLTRRSGAALVALASTFIVGTLVAAGIGYEHWNRSRVTATIDGGTVRAEPAAVSTPLADRSGAESAPAPPSSVPAAPEIPPAKAEPARSPEELAIPPGTGLLVSEDAVVNRRIFVDDRVVGQTPKPVRVKCGLRAIRVGSSGVRRKVDVPCGGTVTVR